MNVAEFKDALAAAGSNPVQFRLPGGDLVPAHFHVTEVGRVDKSFVDCGGTQRQASSCLIQVWVANDLDHRLGASKLLKIMEVASPLLKSDSLPVEVEYGSRVAGQYTLTDAVVGLMDVTFSLEGRQTDCLAKDQCGLEACTTGSGCC